MEDSKISERAAQVMMPGGGGIGQWSETRAPEPDFLGVDCVMPHAS